MAPNHTTAKRSAVGGTADNRSTKRQNCNYEDIIKILVGPEERRFIAHKDIICMKSKFFRTACSKRRRDEQNFTVRLPEIHASYKFQTYMDWTYTNELAYEEAVSTQNGCFVVRSLVELYLLGDVLKDVKLRNKVLRSLSMQIRQLNLSLSPEQCDFAWKNTAPNSPLRKVIVDHFVTLTSPEVLRKYSAEWPADLALQIALMLMDRYVKDENVDMNALEARVESYMEAENDV